MESVAVTFAVALAVVDCANDRAEIVSSRTAVKSNIRFHRETPLMICV